MKKTGLLTAQGDRELFLETLINRSKDGILVIDQEGLVLFANSAAEDMFSDQEEDLLGSQIGTPVIRDDVELRLPQGDEIRTVEMRASHMTWEDQQVYIVTLRDVTNRVKEEQELRKREELLRETGRIARVGGWEIDFETNTVWWSDVTREIHEVPEGYEPTLDEAIDFFPPEVQQTLQGAIQRAREDGDPFDLELPFVTAEGNARWVRAIGKGERRPGGKMRVQGTFQDITEQKMAWDRLQESEQKFRHLFEYSIDGFALHDIITEEDGSPVDFVYLDVNQAFEKHIGLKPEDVIGKQGSEVLDGVQETALLDIFARVALSRESEQFEFYFPQLERQFLISAYSPQEGQFATIFYDISERVQAENALKTSEEKFRTLFETMAQGVVYQNAEGEITSANPAAERILGLSLDQVQGKTILDLDWEAVDLNGNLLVGDQHPAMVALRSGEVVDDFVFGVYRPQRDEPVWISVSAIPQFKTGSDEPYQVFTTFLDISDRVRVEKSLHERVKELRCISAVSAEIQRKPTLEELGQKTAELLIPAMHHPEIAAPVVVMDEQRFESDRYHSGLKHNLRAEIRGKQGSHGFISVYYTEDTPFLIPEEQHLLDQVAEILALWFEQTQAQRKLQESEYQLDLAIQSAELGVWDWDLEEDTLAINELFAGMLDYRLDEVGAEMDFWRDHIHPDDREKVQAAIDAHLNGETPVYQVRHRLLAKGGDAIHVLGTGKIMERTSEGEPARFVGVIKEITKLVQAEEDLRFQANLLDAVGQAVIATNAEGQINYWNRAAEELYGWSAEDVRGKNILDVTPTGASRDQAEEIMSTLMNGEMWSGEFEVQHRDGTTFPAIITDTPILDEDGNLKGVIGVTTDISERIEAERARQRSERRFRALIENAQDMITIVDEEGTIVYNSPAIQNVLGYTPEEHDGKKVFEFVHPDDLAGVMKYFQKGVGESEEAGRIEFRMQHKNGDYRMIESVGNNALEDPGVEGFVINSRDVTQRHENEKLIERQLELLFIQQQIASAGVETNDQNRIIEQATELIINAFSLNNGGVLLMNEKKDVLERHPSYHMDKEIGSFATSTRLGEGVIGRVAESGEPLNISNVNEFEEYRQISPGVKSELCVPIQSGHHLWGVINLETDEVDAFGPADEHMLITAADQLATVLDKVHNVNEAQQRMSRLHAMREIDQAISGSLDIETTLNIVVDWMIKSLEVDAAAVLLYQSDLNVLEFVSGRGFRADEISRENHSLGEGIRGEIVLKRKMIQIRDLPEEAVRSDFMKLMAREDFVSYVGVPLIAKGVIVGVMEVFQRSKFDPSQEWLDFLATLAGQASIAIDHLQLFHDLERSNFDLIRAYNEVIEGWAKALELRDRETEGHSRRVEQLTLDIARKMGIQGDQLAHIRQGTLLHDIGKMGIPDQILHKPGKLSEAEWEVMRKHPTFAYELLSPIDHLKPALAIPYSHHEKWDGSGYPQGLRGEEIPLEARIFAVVDVWDALRSDRPYRDAWSDQRTLEYIKEQSGEHFDPRVVDVFLDAIDQEQ